ncbi:MAG: hypothetical protein ACHBN1_32530 [Heteroscytonema crispum UTEX LB 1556]
MVVGCWGAKSAGGKIPSGELRALGRVSRPRRLVKRDRVVKSDLRV